jgi:hypothetical protein
MSRRQVILDNETSSLIPDYETGTGVIWELGCIERGGTAHLWRMKPDLARADLDALRVGRFYERTAGMCEDCTPKRAHDLTLPLTSRGKREWSAPGVLAAEVARLLDDATVIAANPTFDANFLTAFLKHYGQAGTWHYRLRDIGSMAYGYLCAQRDEGVILAADMPPIDASTDDFALALHVDPGSFERHSALGDCWLVEAMLAAIEGGKP